MGPAPEHRKSPTMGGFLPHREAAAHSTRDTVSRRTCFNVQPPHPDPTGDDLMKFAAPFSTRTPGVEGRPRDDELDLFGLTHPGQVRAENQDHFLLCTVHPQVVVHATSLSDPDELALRGQRLATILLVADGVGGSAAGSKASRIATEAVTEYVASALRSYHTTGS